MDEGVVITGIGVVSPLNPDGDPERFWASVRKGENAVRRIRSFDASRYPCQVAAEVLREEPEDESIDPALRLAQDAFRRALGEARLALGEYDARRAGIVVGTVLGGVSSGADYFRVTGSGRSFGGDRLKQYPLGAIASRLARVGSLRGPVLTVSTACASGTDAVGVAARRIREGRADIMIAGGVDALSEFSFSGFCALNALTFDAVRPFSRNRSGLALGEGAAFLVLEREQSAMRRDVQLLGRVAGYASTSDATHLTAPNREGSGLASAAAAACREGGVAPARIDYVSAHGTGTLYNDAMETRALKSLLGPHYKEVPVSSIKAGLGHSFGAAGAMEALVCLFAIRDGVVPPTANFEEPDPDCDIDCVPNSERSVAVRTALSLSAGFGGQNAALVLGCAE